MTTNEKAKMEEIGREFDGARKLWAWYLGGMITREEFDYGMMVYNMRGL